MADTPSEEHSLPRPRQPRLLPRAGRLPPHWSRGRSPVRGRGHRRIPVPVPRRSSVVGRSPEGFLTAPGYRNGEAVEWNRSFQEGHPSEYQRTQRKPEGPVRGHSVPDPYHGASGGDDGEDWQNIAPPVSSSYSLPELPHLSEDERQRIMEVIRRDEHLRRQDELRVMRLKAELQFLRRKGALRADWDPPTGGSPAGLGSGNGRSCARCRAELGRIINRGAFCRACRLRVCKACREYNVRATDWVCSVCHKHMEIQVATGEWMNEFVRRPSRRRDNRVYVPAADIVKRSIRRSWTISTSHRRSFGGPHGSPELRAYSSLPRGASYLPVAAAEAAADAADAAADARRLTEARETTPHRRLPANPLFSLLRRGSSGGDDLPHRKATSLEEDIISGTLARDDSVFVETRQDSVGGSPGKKNLGRKGASLRRQQAVWTGSTGSTGPESSGGESPGQLPRSPKTKEFVSKEEGRVEEDEEEPVEDFDVEPISGTIFRKVTIKKKKNKVNVSEEEGDDSGVGDAGTTTPTSASPTVAPSPSLGRSEKQPVELSRRLGTQESGEGGSPAAAALLLDYVLDEGKIQPDGEDYKLVFISSDSSSKASSSNSDEEAHEDCDWDYFEPARAVVVREVPPEVSKLVPATQSEGVLSRALTDHIFFVEPMPAADQAGVEGGLAVSRRARRRRARRVGRSRSETDLARLHLRLPDDARFPGERSGSGGFEGPTILAAGEFGPAEGTGIRMWTVERDTEEYGGKRTIIPVPVPVPAWPARFEKEGEGTLGESVADIVYLGPAGSNAVRIRIRSFQRSQPTSVPHSSHVSVVGSASSSWYAWHRVLDSPTQAFTSSVTLSSSLQDCYSEGVGGPSAGGLKEIIEINTPTCIGFQKGETSYSPSDGDVESGPETGEESKEVDLIEPGTVEEKEGECESVTEGKAEDGVGGDEEKKEEIDEKSSLENIFKEADFATDNKSTNDGDCEVISKDSEVKHEMEDKESAEDGEEIEAEERDEEEVVENEECKDATESRNAIEEKRIAVEAIEGGEESLIEVGDKGDKEEVRCQETEDKAQMEEEASIGVATQSSEKESFTTIIDGTDFRMEDEEKAEEMFPEECIWTLFEEETFDGNEGDCEAMQMAEIEDADASAAGASEAVVEEEPSHMMVEGENKEEVTSTVERVESEEKEVVLLSYRPLFDSEEKVAEDGGHSTGEKEISRVAVGGVEERREGEKCRSAVQERGEEGAKGRRRRRKRRRRRGKKAVVVEAPPDESDETSSGEFDLASAPRWAIMVGSIMTPPSVSSNSDAAGNSEESDSDDENFSRVFVVNPLDDEEDEGVERGEEEEGREGGEVIPEEAVEGAVLPYGAGVRLMHIRALTDHDHVAAPTAEENAVVQDGRHAHFSPPGDLPYIEDELPRVVSEGEKIHVEKDCLPTEKASEISPLLCDESDEEVKGGEETVALETAGESRESGESDDGRLSNSSGHDVLDESVEGKEDQVESADEVKEDNKWSGDEEGNMLPLSGCGEEAKPPSVAEGERTPEGEWVKEDRISAQFHAKGEQVSPEEVSLPPALEGGEGSEDGSEMAPASDSGESVGGESPEVAEESDPVPAAETPGSVEEWKAEREEGSWGGGRGGEGRCVSLEDILNPEGRSILGAESAITTGGGGGVYTSYVMITQDGGASREGLRRECHDVEGAEEGVGEDVSGRHQRVNVSVVTTETTTLVSEEEEEEMEEENDGELSDDGGVVLRHVNWEEEEGKRNMGLAGYFTLTLETGTASPTPPRRPEIRKTIQLKDPSINSNGVVDVPISGDLSGGEESDDGRNGDAVKVVTGGDTLSAVVCLEEGLADDDSWVEEVDATIDDLRDDDDDELGSESASSGDEAYFDREEELRGYNRAIDFTLHTILEESGEEESEAENNKSSTQGNLGQTTPGSKQNKANTSNAETDASELEKYYFFGLGNAQDDGNDDQKFANEESEISDTVSETSCSSIYSEGLESLGIAGTPGHDGITETNENILGMDPAELASSRLEKYFLTGFLGLEPPRGLRAPLGDEDGFSENTDESGSVGSDSEGRHSPEQRRKRLVRARGAGRQHHNSGGSGGAASDAEAAAGSPSGGESSSIPQVTHSQNHLQQQQKILGQQQQQQAQNSGQEAAEGEDSSTETDSFDETAFEKGDGQFDTVKRKKKKRKENRHQEDGKEDCVAVSGEEMDGAKTPQPDLETVAEEEEEDTGNTEGREEEVAALEVENGLGPGGQGGRKQASRDSGFIGSCDDLLKDQQQQRISDGEQRSSGSDRDIKKVAQKDNNVEETVKEDALKDKGEEETQVPTDIDPKPTLDVIGETEVAPTPVQRPVPSGSPASISRTSLSRKDSFNNWSSDEETNLMMSKMRAFFKTMVAGKMASGLRRSNSGRQGSGGEAHSASSSTNGDVPEPVEKVKPPQLVYFENELTRLMKTVPGIRDEQVKEIVEYLSSEDTWSDSYDSSDYTSSDLEGAGYHGRGPLRTELQQQISASCQQIIRNFDNCTDDIEDDENFARPKSNGAPISDAMHKETAFVYQRLVASFGKVAGGVGEPSSSDASSTPHSSPPLIAKVMHHIGGRLVALMHEVSAAGEGPLPSSSSPNGSPFTRNINAAGSPKTGNNQVAATMAARYRRLLRREAAAAAKDDKGSVTSTSVESECPSTDTEERSVDSDADSSSSSPPPMSRLPSLPRSKSHDLGQWQRLLLANEENRKVSAAHSYYYGYSAMGSSGGGVVGPGTMMSSSGAHPGGVGGRDNKESLRSSSSGVSDLAEEREEYERLSWRGSFESALAADSRTKLSLEAKRRSAGSGSGSASDLCSSNDQLDHRGRVRSCGSITSAGSRGSLLQQQQLGARARLSASGGDLLAYRSSASRGTVAEEHEGEGDDEGDGDVVGSNGALSRRRRSVPDARGPPGERSTTLPRSNTAVSASTNSLPRLPTGSAPPHGTAAAAIHKSQSLMGHHLQQAHQQPHHHHHHLFLQNVKSARYRPPGFRPPPVPPVPPKRAVSVPGLNHQNRGRGEKRRQSSGDDAISISETKCSSQPVGNITPSAGSAPPTPGGGKKVSTGSWTTPPTSPAVIANEEETTSERVPNTHHQSSSLGLRSDSMASVYSGAGEGRYGTVAVRGEVEFALQYNYKQGALEILVKQCRELAPVDTKRNRSDPYVKVYLLPDKSKSGKRKTKVKKHTLNPVFDETLKFHITLNGLETRTLWLTVWHSDMFGRNDFLGEVMMSLENKVFDDPTPKWYPLQERTEPFDDLLCYKGEMIVGLKFVPPDVTNLHKKGRLSRGSLHVLVKDAKNLTAVKTNGTSDPFCKSYLLPDKGRSSKQKTAVCRRTVNPVWNHTFVYEDVSLQELSERSLELTVWDHDRLASNEFLGGLRFNLGTGKHYGKSVDWMDATGREMTLWQSMLERANFWVEGCLTLRPTLDHRSSPSSTLAS